MDVKQGEKFMNNDDETRYVITEQALMQITLHDFNIDVSLSMAKAIYETFMYGMIKAGGI